jgi:glycosyltransferase involved in cell wall biosynthesis
MLIHACARLRRPTSSGVPSTPELVILGDGPERRRLARLAAALDLPVRLPGFVSRDEVARWLRAADVFAQPSVRLANGRTEGAPVALAEARAVGTPVVVAADPVELERGLRAVTSV